MATVNQICALLELIKIDLWWENVRRARCSVTAPAR